MSNEWVDFESVKAAVTAEAVLAHYAITDLRKERGDELRGRCPIHQGDGKRSFHLSTSKKAFKCFSCGAAGNLIDFVAAMEKCSFRDAALRLQGWLGIAGEAPRPTSTTIKETGAELTREKRAESGAEESANKPLAFQLRGIDYGHGYLAERGITKETAEHFGSGYFPGKGSMAGRVVIPIHNAAGELVGYAGRSIDGSEPKYKVPAGFHKVAELYNLHRAAAAGDRGLIVVEGFFDAMKVHQAGYPFVVALMGCSMSEQQESLLISHADQVVLMLDGDEAGQRGMQDISWRLAQHLWVRAVVLPEGKQPDHLPAEQLVGALGQK